MAKLGLKPKLFIVCGPPGVGKTTIARTLAKKIHAAVLTSEFVIIELFGKTSNKNKDKDFSEKEIIQGYKTMNMNTKKLLQLNKSVVLDGVYRSNEQRNAALKLAKESGIKYFIIKVECPEQIVKERINERLKMGKQPGGYKTHIHLKSLFEPIRGKHHIIDTSRDIEEQINNFVKKNLI